MDASTALATNAERAGHADVPRSQSGSYQFLSFASTMTRQALLP